MKEDRKRYKKRKRNRRRKQIKIIEGKSLKKSINRFRKTRKKNKK